MCIRDRMNNTTHMENGEMETLIQKLDDVIDPSIFLSVRTPAQWRTIVGCLLYTSRCV